MTEVCTTPPIRTPEPDVAPVCRDWCTSSDRCKWEPPNEKGARLYGVPLDTWTVDHQVRDAGELIWVYGREFSHEPGRITTTTTAAFFDLGLIQDEEAAQPAEMRGAAAQMLRAADMIEAVTS